MASLELAWVMSNMSKFVDKLTKLSRGRGPAIGFKRSAAPQGPSLLLAVEVSASDISAAKDVMAVGIDALAVRIDSLVGQAAGLKDAAKLFGNTAWGVHIGKTGPDDVATLRDLGCDFLILNAVSTPAAILSDSGLGRILSVDPGWGDGLIRALDQLALDALLWDAEAEQARGLSLHHLLLCHRLASLTRQPILVGTSPGLEGTDLRALYSIGVEGILHKYEAGASFEPLQEIRRSIDALPPYRGRGRSIALLPRLEAVTPAETEEEEEEEE